MNDQTSQTNEIEITVIEITEQGAYWLEFLSREGAAAVFLALRMAYGLHFAGSDRYDMLIPSNVLSDFFRLGLVEPRGPAYYITALGRQVLQNYEQDLAEKVAEINRQAQIAGLLRNAGNSVYQALHLLGAYMDHMPDSREAVEDISTDLRAILSQIDSLK